MSYPKASSVAETQDNHFPVQPHFRDDEKGNGQATNNMEDIVPETDPQKLSASQGDDSAADGEAGVTRLIDGPLEGTGDSVANYVDNVGVSSANPQPPRKRSAGSSVHPRNRTLSESVQAYLLRPVAPRYLPKKASVVSGDEQPTATGSSTADMRPNLLRLTDEPDSDIDIGKLPSPRTTTVERTVDGDPSTLDDDAASEQHHGRHFQTCIYSSSRASFTVAKHADKAPSMDDQVRGRTDADTPPSPAVAAPSVFHDSDASGDGLATFVSESTSRSGSSETEVDVMAALEKRLRARARVRVRLAAAIKGVGGGAVGSGSG